MKNKNKLKLILSIMIVGIIPTITYAENRERENNRDDRRPENMKMNQGMMYRKDNSSTTTPVMNRNKNQQNVGIGGVIKTISPTLLTIDNIGRNNATTTYNVNLNASTTYRYGTTTSSFSSLTIGQHVMVLGNLSTTTKTIDAKSVNIIDSEIRNRDIDNKTIKASSTSSNESGMFHKMLNWFKNKFK